jgi:hypothetical protein
MEVNKEKNKLETPEPITDNPDLNYHPKKHLRFPKLSVNPLYLLMMISGIALIVLVRSNLSKPNQTTEIRSRADENTLDLTITPANITMPPSDSVAVILNAQNHQMGFIFVRLNFDKSKINVASDIQTSGLYEKVVSLTTPAQANSTGVITIVLAPYDPMQHPTPPTPTPSPTIPTVPSGTIQVATIQFKSMTADANISTAVTFDQSATQLVDFNNAALILNANYTNGTILLNPQDTNTPAPSDTMMPTNTQPPQPSDTPVPTETETPIPTPTETVAPGMPTNTPAPSNTPAPTNKVAPSSTPYPTYTPYPTHTPYPSNTPLPSNYPTYTPYPTNSPYPTHTTAPTTTPIYRYVKPANTATPRPTVRPTPTPVQYANRFTNTPNPQAQYPTSTPYPDFVSIPHPTPSMTNKGDFNGDGVVDFKDLSELFTNSIFGVQDTTVDVNGDGKVNLIDLFAFFGYFGRKYTPANTTTY